MKHYKLACLANGEDAEDDYIRLLPLILVGAASEWYLDLTNTKRADWGNINTLFLKRFGFERLEDDLVRLISLVKMDRKENVIEYIDQVQRLKNACATLPIEPYLITWFISSLKSSIKCEMKKERRYATFAEASEVAMDIEDEGAWSNEATTFEAVYLANSPALIKVEDRTGPMEGQALIDTAVKATRDEWQKERETFMDNLVQAIEGNIRIVRPAQREYMWC